LEVIMKTFKGKLLTLVATLVVTFGAALIAPANTQAQALDQTQLGRSVRHELVTLPYYGVFDNLAYQINGSTVTLYGQVVQPTTRSDAAARVAHLPGVTRVVNRIQVLPLSGFDDQIRARAYRTIFSTGDLGRYSMGTNPSLHIIVNNGHLTLEGVVDNEMDRRLAYIAARQVPGVFSVTNNLRTDRDNSRSVR
jgi:hyperosmotically inducible periplasmic protein